MRNVLHAAVIAAATLVFAGCAAKQPAASNAPATGGAPASAEPVTASMPKCCTVDAAGAHSCEHGGGGCCDSHAAK